MSAATDGSPTATTPELVAVAFCPSPPLLLPAVEGRAAEETTALRSACDVAVGRLLSTAPESVVVVGDGAPAGARFGPGDAADLHGFGRELLVPFAGPAREGATSVPLAHAVGAWLLDRAGYDGRRLGVGPDGLAAALAELGGRIAILAVGDGSARRTLKAPGYLDDAAAPFDAAVAAALAAADPAALAALDAAEGARLLAAGVPTWRAVGAALSGRRFTGSLRYDDAPYGVGYLVADWVAA